MTNHKQEMAIALMRAARDLAQQEQAMKELSAQLDKPSDEDFNTVQGLAMTAVSSIGKFSTGFMQHGNLLLTLAEEHIKQHIKQHTTK